MLRIIRYFDKGEIMAHWGWYWWVKLNHKAKRLCSQLPSIDSSTIMKQKCTPIFSVPNYHNLWAILTEKGFKVTYGKQKSHSYIIPVEKQPCNYGGHRYYFHCPACNRRMRILYFSEGLFLCRKCLNLSYDTQQARPVNRYLLMQEKIEKRLKDKGGDCYQRPKWMRRKRFKKLCSEHLEYEFKCEDAMMNELIEWYPNQRMFEHL